MALTHSFFSIRSNDFDDIVTNILKNNLSEIVEQKDIMSIYDSVLQFVSNTLNWVKTKDYKNKKDHDGLYYHGITIIYPDQVITLKKIIEGWVVMFNCAPDLFLMNQYDEEKTKKEMIVLELNDFIVFLNGVIKNENYLIHSGI